MKPKFLNSIFVLFFVLGCSTRDSLKPTFKEAQTTSPVRASYVEQRDRSEQEKIFKTLAVSTQNIHTSEIARDIYKSGGNIIDAMVAASFAISVERPQSTGIGGGGFLLYYHAKDKKVYAVDFRERAPLAAHEKMFQNELGQVVQDLSVTGGLASATPGLVRGLFEVHRKWGKLPWKRVVMPAAQLAENGFEVYSHLANMIGYRKSALEKFPETKKYFFNSSGEPLKKSDKIYFKDLAKTLKRIAQFGPEGFYKGPVAQAIIETSKKTGGILSQTDLDSYKVRWLKPLEVSFYGKRLYTMPPPSSALHLVQAIGAFSRFQFETEEYQSARHFHILGSSFQRAFADRAEFLGDPDFYKVPTDTLISEKYLDKLASQIREDRAFGSDKIKPGAGIVPYESTETTHFSIMDSEGNAVSSTQTVNGPFGSSVMVEGFGFLLNNEMDDLVAKAGVPNMFGAVGGKANSIAPGKTPLSSMSPTLVMNEETGKIELSIGSPGGTRIITCVAQTLVNYFTFKRPLFESISDIRLHHQWKPDVLSIEKPGPSEIIQQKLKNLRHNLTIEDVPCRVMAVAREGDQLHAVTDPRDGGTVEGI